MELDSLDHTFSEPKKKAEVRSAAFFNQWLWFYKFAPDSFFDKMHIVFILFVKILLLKIKKFHYPEKLCEIQKKC